MNEVFFPEAEPVNVKMAPSLELSYPINRCGIMLDDDKKADGA